MGPRPHVSEHSSGYWSDPGIDETVTGRLNEAGGSGLVLFLL
jgi:hypothetical protein